MSPCYELRSADGETIGHLCRGAGWGPWESLEGKPLEENGWLRRGRVLTDCCLRRVLPSEARIRWTLPEAYYDPTPDVQCLPDTGCHVRPRLLFGLAGRSYWSGRW